MKTLKIEEYALMFGANLSYFKYVAEKNLKQQNKMYAEDVVFSSWEKFNNLLQQKRYSEQEKFKGYITFLIRNSAIDFNRREPDKTDLDDAKGISISATDYVDDDTFKKIRLIRKTAKKLPRKQKKAFIEFYYEGHKYKDIAEFENTSVSTILARVREARESIKNRLNK